MKLIKIRANRVGVKDRPKQFPIVGMKWSNNVKCFTFPMYLLTYNLERFNRYKISYEIDFEYEKVMYPNSELIAGVDLREISGEIYPGDYSNLKTVIFTKENWLANIKSKRMKKAIEDVKQYEKRIVRLSKPLTHYDHRTILGALKIMGHPLAYNVNWFKTRYFIMAPSYYNSEIWEYRGDKNRPELLNEIIGKLS